MSSLPYEYPGTNSQIIKTLGLLRHVEGGYFAETDRYEEIVPSPFADDAPRPVATTIYYLLTADEPRGYIHRNKSHTMHVHHQGRSLYTLIHPAQRGSPSGPTVTTTVMGNNTQLGEKRQFFVAGGVWKMSGIPEEDLRGISDPSVKEKIGCLISEVVTPGFVWEDHEWLTMDGLRELFEGAEDAEEKIKQFSKHVRPERLGE